MNIPREFDEANAVYIRQLRAMYRPVPMPEPDPKTAALIEYIRQLRAMYRPIPQPEPDPKTAALIDIAHDCGTLEAAQRRAKDALRQATN